MMADKGRYKLRSSLKKTTSKVSVELNDENLDLTMLPQRRRVSFAASNYVKPFIDDPEKNTIWDNTYEEQVDSTADSAKSTSTHNPSQNINESLILSRTLNKTVIFNQSEMEMEYTLQDMIVESVKENINKTNPTYEQTLLDMEMTCINKTVDKENTCQINRLLPQNTKNKMNYIMSETNLNESGMEMTCNYNFPSNIITWAPILDQTKIQNESMEFTCQLSIQKNLITQPVDLENKENYIVHSASVIPVIHSVVDKENKIMDIHHTNCTVTLDHTSHTINNSEAVQESKHQSQTEQEATSENAFTLGPSNVSKVNVCNDPVNQSNLIHGKHKNEPGKIPFYPLGEQSQPLDLTDHKLTSFKIQNIEPEENVMNDQQTIDINCGKSVVFGGIPIAVDLSNQSVDLKIDKPSDSKDRNTSTENVPDVVRDNGSCMATDLLSQSIKLPVNKSADFNVCDPTVDFSKLSIGKEECSLVDSLPSLDEIELQHLSTTYFKSNNEDVDEPSVKEDVPLHKELPAEETREKIISYTKHPNKVIYSEPMMVTKPAVTDSVSMHNSGLNFFNFNSILSMEDTQQLIQTTFSKPSFQCTEEERIQSPTVSKFNLSTDATQSVIDNIMSDTFKAQDILNNIENILNQDDFMEYDFEAAISEIKESQNIRMKIETLLKEIHLLEAKAFDLEEINKRRSLGMSTHDLTGVNRFSCSLVRQDSDSVDTCEDKCQEYSITESLKSLNDSIVEICDRSRNVLKMDVCDNNCYIFKTVYELVIIFVRLHKEDNHVVEIKCQSCVKESQLLVRLIVDNILDRLSMNKLKSYLGPHFDILSLLDYILVLAEQTEQFYIEFLTLQEEYVTLTVEDDLSVSFGILCTKPPIHWSVNLRMLPIYKIDSDSVTVQSRFGKVNEEHIRQIARNIEENVQSLRNFIEDVIKYFRRTQVMFKNLNMK